MSLSPPVTTIVTAARSTNICRLLTSGPEATHTSCLNIQSETRVCDLPSFDSCQANSHWIFNEGFRRDASVFLKKHNHLQ